MLDLNDLLVEHPEATYLVKVTGDSMIDAGIQENDVLVVDTAKEAAHRDIVIVSVDDGLTVKRLLFGDKVPEEFASF